MHGDLRILHEGRLSDASERIALADDDLIILKIYHLGLRSRPISLLLSCLSFFFLPAPRIFLFLKRCTLLTDRHMRNFLLFRTGHDITSPCYHINKYCGGLSLILR